MTADTERSYELRGLVQGVIKHVQDIETWLNTLGHGESAAAVDTRHVLDVAKGMTETAETLTCVWDSVEAYVRGEVPRKVPDQAVVHYQQRLNPPDTQS